MYRLHLCSKWYTTVPCILVAGDKSKQKSDQASVFIALQMVVRVSVINNLTLEEKMIEQSSS